MGNEQRRPAPWWQKALAVVGLVASTVFVVLFYGRACLAFEPYEDVAVARLNACAEARELLGRPIELALVGPSCHSRGSDSSSHDHGSWSGAVSGPKGRGRYSFHAERSYSERDWVLTEARLRAAGRTIDVVECAGSGKRGTR